MATMIGMAINKTPIQTLESATDVTNLPGTLPLNSVFQAGSRLMIVAERPKQRQVIPGIPQSILAAIVITIQLVLRSIDAFLDESPMWGERCPHQEEYANYAV